MIAWAGGGEATLEALDGDRVTLRSSKPGAPGQTLVGALDGAELKVKVAGSRRTPEGAFEVRGRLVDATRALRQALVEALGRAPAG